MSGLTKLTAVVECWYSTAIWPYNEYMLNKDDHQLATSDWTIYLGYHLTVETSERVV